MENAGQLKSYAMHELKKSELKVLRLVHSHRCNRTIILAFFSFFSLASFFFIFVFVIVFYFFYAFSTVCYLLFLRLLEQWHHD